MDCTLSIENGDDLLHMMSNRDQLRSGESRVSF
jgi:hypothetical protein